MKLSRRSLFQTTLALPLLRALPLWAGPASIVATAVPLSKVRLTGGPLKAAQNADIKYLLELEPDRMLAYYRINAGLEKKAEPYGGWDGGKRNLTGHIAGHYLSAIGLMYAATGDARFKDRTDYIVRELVEVQHKQGDGYLGALEGGRRCFEAVARGEIRSGGFDLNGEWSPWYTLHKTYAGLRDAYRHTGNQAALDAEVKYAAWAEGILSKLNDAQIQKMLSTEFGGMSEVLADLSHDTGDSRWMTLSRKFEYRNFTDPLKRHVDNLSGRHGNTVIPQMIGSLARYVYTGDSADLMAASFFFDRVTQHHTYATGGHGQNEYFFDADKLGDHIDGRTCESCNVYNMLKLSRTLFALDPDVHYADFQERALFNHALASIDVASGQTCYMVPVGRGVRHEYQEMTRSFTCCVGSGMENHALHGDGIYYESADRMWVNIYAPSAADGALAKLETSTGFPEGDSAAIRVNSNKEFTLSVRRPAWAGDGFAVKVNGTTIDTPKSGYVDIRRAWKAGDQVEVALPKSLTLEQAGDNSRIAAVMWGPLVLSGDLGPEPTREQFRGRPSATAAAAMLPKRQVFVTATPAPSQWLKQDGYHFRTTGVVRASGEQGVAPELTLVPFYQASKRTYEVYWDIFTAEQWTKEQAAYAAEEARQRRLEAATVVFAQPGEMQPERDFNFQSGEGTTVERAETVSGRRSNSWFSFDLPVDASSPMKLVVTYYTLEFRRGPTSFKIEIDGQKLADEAIERSTPPRFFDREYAIPAAVVAGKQKVTVKFTGTIATVFGLRVVRAE